MAEAIELIRRVPLFADLERRQLEDVAATLKPRSFAAGEEITTEGRRGVGFFVIEDGEASVTVHGRDRARLGRGDWFGEIALVTEGDRSATVTAETDLRCLGMTSWEFRPLVEREPSIAWKLAQALARKLHDAETG